jgi:DNA polymerase III subunit chi
LFRSLPQGEASLTKLDFWQVTDDPIEKVVTLIAKRAVGQGERVLVVCADAEQRAVIARALWQAGPSDSFLANGEAGAPGADKQPILLSDDLAASNGASHVILADGTFRDSPGFARVFLLFPPDAAPAARQAWRAQDGRDDVERAYYAQEDGRWVKKG